MSSESAKIGQNVRVFTDRQGREIGFRINPRPGQYIVHTTVNARNDLEVLPVLCKTPRKAISVAYRLVGENYKSR